MTQTPDAQQTPEWLARRERGSALLLRFMTWLSLTLGRTLTRPIVYGIAFYFLLAAPAVRAASRAYLQRCLGRPVRWRDLYQHIFVFACTIHDRVYLLNDRFDLFDLTVIGDDPLLIPEDPAGGVLLFGAHLGSFEVLRALARKRLPREVCAAMYPENARHLNNMLADVNAAVVNEIIPLGQIDAMLTLRQKVSAGATAALLADRATTATGAQAYAPVNFLGDPALFPLGPFRLAALLRRPIYFMAGLYRGGNRYELRFAPLADFSAIEPAQRTAAMAAAQQRYAELLEAHCRLAPYNWFNFYDFWKDGDRDQG